MRDSRKPFRYSLDSLLKKRNFDHDLLRQEQNQAKQALDDKTVELETAMNSVTDIEEQIRSAQGADVSIEPERMKSMALFLDSRRAAVKEATSQLRQVESIYQQITEQLRKIRQSIRSLEKNRDSRQREFAAEQQRAGYAEMDDLWLTRRNDS